MSTIEAFKKVSAQVETLIPGFIRDEGPKFAAFLRAYHEFLEQTGQATHAIRSFEDNLDIDRAADQFVEYFRREFMHNIPTTVLADKRLLVKHIKEFYRSRGSENSYKFLFRILFDEEIEFYYPGRDLLRVSDGRWVKETFIRAATPTGNVYSLSGVNVTGVISGATGRVEEIQPATESGIPVWELTLLDVRGTFSDGEFIVNTGNTVSAIIFNSLGPLNGALVSNGGAFHVPDDELTITGSEGSAGSLKVGSTSGESAITFRVANGGYGYRKANTRISLTAGSGTGARFEIHSISDQEVLSINTDLVGSMGNITLGTAPTFGTFNGNTATLGSNLYSANGSFTIGSSLTFANVTVGTINAIILHNPGKDYQILPTLAVVDDDIAAQAISDGFGGIKGSDANIVVERAPGAIVTTPVLTRGTGYNRNNPVGLLNARQGHELIWDGKTRRRLTFDAIATPRVEGVTNRPGQYIDTKGWISWNNRLQDNYYWQVFSYVVKSDNVVNQYRDIVKRLLHPAGTIMFGDLRIYDEVVVEYGQDVNGAFGSGEETSNPISEQILDGLFVPVIVMSSEELYTALGAIIVDGPWSLEIDAPSANTEVTLYQYTLGGNFMVVANSSASIWTNYGVTLFANTPVELLGTSKLAISPPPGNFKPLVAAGQTIVLRANTPSMANGVYTVDAVYGNAAMKVIPGTNVEPISNGTYFYQSTKSIISP